MNALSLQAFHVVCCMCRELHAAAHEAQERRMQITVLLETIETLQAGSSSEKEQRLVSLTAQYSAARAKEAALERRAADLLVCRLFVCGRQRGNDPQHCMVVHGVHMHAAAETQSCSDMSFNWMTAHGCLHVHVHIHAVHTTGAGFVIPSSQVLETADVNHHHKTNMMP